jgi:SH3-like domain-containing protein
VLPVAAREANINQDTIWQTSKIYFEERWRIIFMLRSRRVSVLLAGLILCLGLAVMVRLDAEASTKKEYFDSLSVGISQIVDPTVEAVDQKAIEELTQISEANASQEEEESDLVMVNVQVAMNVRAEAAEESDKVGVLYKDCGGRILERKDGWTRLKSGDLIGWASDEYLLFGDEAREMADDVGNLIVQIETDTLRIRREPDTEAEVFGVLTGDDELEMIEYVDNDWISVDYEGETGYVSAEYVDVDFHIDAGETLAAIREREEAERLAKLKANQGAVVVGGDDTKLLAALIQCEAGSETYNGKLAVGAVVMNRVRSGAYPNTVSGVIFASGQFTPALNGKVARVYTNGSISDSCYEAARAAINGETNVGGATHFRRAGNHDGILIDNQVFW